MRNVPHRHRFWFAFASILLTSSGFSSIVAYRAIGNFTSSTFPLDIAIGDHFSVDFTFDDSILDIYEENFVGAFRGALRSLDFRLTPGFSSGSYAGGSASYGVIQTLDRGFDRFYFLIDKGTFPPLSGHSFSDLVFVLDDPSDMSSISDPGGNPSLGTVLHGILNLSQFSDTTFRLNSVNKTGTAQGIVTALSIVPEPNAILLLSGGLAFMLRWRGFSPGK